MSKTQFLLCHKILVIGMGGVRRKRKERSKDNRKERDHSLLRRGYF